MKLNVFGKKRKTAEGRQFVTYSTKLVDKTTGEELFAEVKFREECGTPKNIPCTIEIGKGDANLSEKNETYVSMETGEEKEILRRVLWVNNFVESEFEDDSLDRFI